MPLQKLTPEQIQSLVDQGVDPSAIPEYAEVTPPESMGVGRSILSPLKAHAGSIGLGGLASIAASVALAPETGGLSLAAIPMLVGGTAAGFGGSYVGQKAQEAILGEEKQAALEAEAQKAYKAHPIIAGGSELVAGALAGGGAFSPKTLMSAGRGLGGVMKGVSETPEIIAAAQAARQLTPRQALASVATQAALQPALATGMSLAEGNGVPSVGDLAMQAAGGALFAGDSALNRKMHSVMGKGPRIGEPAPEIIEKSNNETVQNETLQLESAPERKQLGLPNYQDGDKGFTYIDVEATPVTTEKKQNLLPEKSDDYRIPLTEAQQKLNSLLQQGPARTPEFEANRQEAIKREQENIQRLQEFQRAAQERTAQDMADLSQKPVSQNTLRLTAKDLLQPDITRPEVRPEVDTTVPKETIEPIGRSEAERIQDELEGTGAVYGEKGELPITLTNPADTQLHIAKGEANVRSTLETLANKPNHPAQDLANRMLNSADDAGLNVKIELTDTDRPFYDPKTDTIKLTPNARSSTRVMLEEVTHGMTLKNIPEHIKNATGADFIKVANEYIANGDNIHVAELLKSYVESAKRLDMHDILFSEHGLAGNADEVKRAYGEKGGEGTVGYAMGNFVEFIAHTVTNKRFQETLNNMQVGKTTMLKRVMSAIRNILGLDVKTGSMLERALGHAQELIAQKRTEFDVINGKKAFGEKTKLKDKEGTTTEKQGFVRALASTFDKVKEVSTELSEAFHKWRNTYDKYNALGNVAMHDLSKYSTKDINRVTELHREAYRKGKDALSSNLTPAQQEISNIMQKYYGTIADIRREAGMLINGREAGKNQFYVPDMMNERALKIFTERATSPEADHLKDVWAKHIVQEARAKAKDKSKAITYEQALSDISDYVNALGGKKGHYTSTQFGAIRRAHGFGLPEGLRELDGMNSLAKYTKRAATDLATYKELESNDNIASQLKLYNPKTGKIPTNKPALNSAQQVRDAMEWVTGAYRGHMTQTTPKIAATVRVINNALLGGATGIRDTVSIFQNAIPYMNKWSDLGTFAKGVLLARQNSRKALETGARQPSIDRLQFDSAMDGGDKFIIAANKLATGLRKWQGREFLENLSRDITFSVGRELAKSNIIGAKAGHKQSINFLKKFGLSVEGDVTSLTDAKLEAAIDQMAKNFTDRNQGTYGGSGLPLGIVESQFAPFASLLKWSVEKSNAIYQDVYKPFITGENRIPMLTYTLGTIMTGAAIQQLNELMTGKKSQDPTIKEALVKGTPLAIASELATIMQLGSYGGIVGDSMKIISDAAFHGKTPRNIVSFPTATAAVDMQERVTDMIEAIKSGEDSWEVLKNFAVDSITKNVQNVRAIANYTINDEKTERSNKFRDMRVFNELEGAPASNIPKVNPYLGLEAKEFKREEDPTKAMGMVKHLIERAVEESKGNPYELKKRLANLKANNYKTMPDPTTDPVKYKQYMEFIQATQGRDALIKLMQDYNQQRNVNKMKSSMIP